MRVDVRPLMSCVIYDPTYRAQYRRAGLATYAGSALERAKTKERQQEMIDQDTSEALDNSFARDEDGKDSRREPTRDEEQGEASEPDAPTAGRENTGMSTILDGGLGTGVQEDADDR